jgi:hypothetical protein
MDASKVVEELGLTWNALSESKGASALSKFGTTIAKLKDPSVPKEVKLAVSTAMISLLSTATPDAIQAGLMDHLDTIFDYAATTVKTAEDKDVLTPCNYVLSFVQCQAKSANAMPAFTTKMAVIVTRLLRDFEQLLPSLKEKGPSDPDELIHTKTESIKLLAKCVSPGDDEAVAKALVQLMKYYAVMTQEKKTPLFRAAIIEFVSAVAERKPELLGEHFAVAVDAVQAGEFPLVVGQLMDAFMTYARTNSGAAKLGGLVPALMREPPMTGAVKTEAVCKKYLSLLLRIAALKVPRRCDAMRWSCARLVARPVAHRTSCPPSHSIPRHCHPSPTP